MLCEQYGIRFIKTSVFLFLFLLNIAPLSAAITVEKTPNDVYHEVQLLADQMKSLRKANNINTPWPHLESTEVRAPRHVFQKTLEILSKLNRYRVNILKIGPIAVSRFPGRDITPNEVFNVVVRLREELTLFVPEYTNYSDLTEHKNHHLIKTPNDVYIALSEVSIALEEALGLRVITPSEVYTRSLEIIERVRFLRSSQGQAITVPRPAKPKDKFPNHALQSVYKLLAKIRAVEKNLWIEPVTVPSIPRRVISPGDVYDALGVVSAELQYIQFRLGLEREFPTPKQQYNKTPDDIINIIDWATALLPEFELGQHLQQYDRTTLLKTPNQVFSITEHILKELKAYRNLKGIKGEIRKADKINGLKPQHVYAKGLEILEKVNALRQRQQYGAIAVPNYPLRLITPTEVFDLTLRLDEELAILYRTIDMKSDLWITSSSIKEYHDKTASDVFYKMQQLSNTLDTILGTGGYTSNDVYKTVLTIKEDIQLIADKLGEPLPKDTWIKTQKLHSTQPKDVLIFSQKVLSLIYDAKQRAGLFDLTEIHLSYGEKVTPTDVFNQVRLVQTELIDLKIALGIKITPTIQYTTIERTPADVLHILKGSAKALQIILHTSGEQL